MEIKDIRKVFKIGKEKIVALNQISLDIYQGEVCVFLGTSGSGKSTLLNMIAGLEKPTKGYVKILGKKVTSMKENELAKFRQEHIGFIFQAYNLMPTLTATENVSMPLTFKRVKKYDREKEARSLLKAVGLKTHYRHKPTQMSGGQQQRVGIARAFVGTPSIIFADEPTGNLDSKTSSEVMQLMLKLTKERNQTLVIVTHDREIAKYGDKVVYILDGNIEKVEVNDGDTRGFIHEHYEVKED